MAASSKVFLKTKPGDNTMRTRTTVIILFICLSCRLSYRTEQAASLFDSIPSNICITTKTIVHDSASSKDLNKCIEIPKEINNLNSCIIKSGNKRFIREYTLLLNNEGKIVSLYRYLPEGPDITSLDELQRDTRLLSAFHIPLANNITINRSKGVLIDNNDTLAIIDHWREIKMLVVNPGPILVKNRRALIYGYE